MAAFQKDEFKVMKVRDLYPESGQSQTLYCDYCSEPMSLIFCLFDEVIEGIRLVVEDLPFLYCDCCCRKYLPDRSRIALIDLHLSAWKTGNDRLYSKRQKRNDNFKFTDEIRFIYDPDDYYYIPGLSRSHDEGFLTPVFFRKTVLIRFDNSPEYAVSFGSKTYGQIYRGTEYGIPFGINKHNRVVMWLGDIATLPLEEQHVLRGDNIESDHCVGSEFYDAQIECKFTDSSPEESLIKARSKFHRTASARFGKRLSQLDQETLMLIQELKPPVTFTEKEVKNAIDILHKLNVETLNSRNLEYLISERGKSVNKLGSLKKLERLLQQELSDQNISFVLAPLFALNNLRTMYFHMQSASKRQDRVKRVEQILEIENDSPISKLYEVLLAKITNSYTELAELLFAPKD